MEGAFCCSVQLTKHPAKPEAGYVKKWYHTEERRIMKKLSSKKKIRQIRMLNKNIQKIKLRKNKRVKDEKKAAERERVLPRNR